MIANGTYRARATGACVLGTSAQKGTPFIEFYFKVSEGDQAGSMVKWTGYFTENTNERTVAALLLCGWQGEDPSDFADGELHGLDSNDVDIVVEIEEYEKEGETKRSAKVQWVNRPGGYLNVANAMKTDAAKSFGDRMRGLVIAMRSKTPASPVADDFPHGAHDPRPDAPIASSPPGKKAF